MLGTDSTLKPGFWRAPTRARSTISTRRCAALKRYIKAGADGIFIEAPRSVKELEQIGKAFDVPQICNPLMGGHTPILTMEELGELGFNCAVLGLDTIMHAAKAVEAVLLDMKSGQVSRGETTAWISRTTRRSSATTNGRAWTSSLHRAHNDRVIHAESRAPRIKATNPGRRLKPAPARASTPWPTPGPSARGCAARYRRTASASLRRSG